MYTIVILQPPPAKYGGRHTVTLIPGDGIGPELLNHVREVFRSVEIVFEILTSGACGWFRICFLHLRCRFSCVPVDFEVVHVNSALEGEDDIKNAITAIRRNGVALKGTQALLICFLLLIKEDPGCDV